MFRFIAAVMIVLALPLAALADPHRDLPVDVNRYAGTWYEIARLPHFFQRKCARDVTATYRLAGDVVQVTNRCVDADGKAMSVDGRARIIDRTTNRHLKVGFFSIFGWYPIEGDYRILDLEPSYRWVIIGGADHEYGWILSRTPALDAATRAGINARLKSLGYDPATFINTVQTAR